LLHPGRPDEDSSYSAPNRRNRAKDAEEIAMQNKLNSERGMSLVEATIILMVLAILTSVLAPSLGDYVNEARHEKVKEDTEALGMGIMRLLRDTGLPFLVRTAGATPSRASTNRVDLLVSEGAIPTAVVSTGTAQTVAGYIVDLDVRWDDAVGAEVELATDHLVTNANAYSTVTFPAAGGPHTGLGWRGAYINTSTGPDPWGTRYACTTVWLNPSSDVTVAASKGTNNDAYCLSAGADTTVDTDMDSTANGAVSLQGDDVAFVFQGNTR
jgi:type II secretory pathway pseudopilin PulG